LIANIATVKNEAQFSFLVHVWKTVASSGTPEQLSARKASIAPRSRNCARTGALRKHTRRQRPF